MSDRIEITVQGHLGAEPVRRVSATGSEWATFRVGSTPRYRDAQTGEYKGLRTEWFTVKAWGALAANIFDSLHKATPVIVRGKVFVDVWAGDKGERWDHVIYADAVAIDLAKGTAKYIKTIREAPTVSDPYSSDAGGGAGTLTDSRGMRFASEDLPDEPPGDDLEEEDVDADDGTDLDETHTLTGAVTGG